MILKRDSDSGRKISKLGIMIMFAFPMFLNGTIISSKVDKALGNGFQPNAMWVIKALIMIGNLYLQYYCLIYLISIELGKLV